MNDNQERIESLRYQIEKLSSMITKDIEHLDSSSSFAEKFTAKYNAKSLELSKQKLKHLLANQPENELEFHLTGKSVGKGIAPADAVTSLISNFQKLMQRVVQSLSEVSPGPKMTDSIKNATALQISAFESGSFCIRLKSPAEDADLFSGDQSILDDSPVNKATKFIMDAFSQDTLEESIEYVMRKGIYVRQEYYHFIDTAARHELNIDTTWIRSNKQFIKHSIPADRFKQLKELMEVKRVDVTKETHTGYFLVINAKNSTLNFVSSQLSKSIIITYTPETLPLLRKYQVNPFEENPFKIVLTKKTTSSGANIHINYLLENITPIESK